MLVNVPTHPATPAARPMRPIATATNPPAVNEFAAILFAHRGHDGLSETDRMVLIAADRAAAVKEISNLRDALAEANAFIAALQEGYSY